MSRKLKPKERQYLRCERHRLAQRSLELHGDIDPIEINGVIDERRDWLLGRSAWARRQETFISHRWRRAIRQLKSWSDIPEFNPGPANGSGIRYASCVFHQERTPSLKLSPLGLCYCLGCGHGADIVDVAIRLHDLRTVRDVKRFFGIPDGLSPTDWLASIQPPAAS